MNNRSNIRVGAAVVPYCNKQRCWLLPSGNKQTDRRVYSRELAVQYGHRINQLIGGVL